MAPGVHPKGNRGRAGPRGLSSVIIPPLPFSEPIPKLLPFRSKFPPFTTRFVVPETPNAKSVSSTSVPLSSSTPPVNLL